MNAPLPPGQHERRDFPRFGLGLFARRFPTQISRPEISIGGDVAHALTIDLSRTALTRVEQQSDFHCVTTWSRRGLRWGGLRFSDVYQQLVLTQAQPHADARFVVFKGQDGYRCALPLDDLLVQDVLLADQLDGAPLGLDHGAPLRLVAPAHYGYKNVKHLSAIEFWRDSSGYRFPQPYPRFMDHPRGRVAFEERGRLPAWLLRPVYRLLIASTVRNFQRALERYRQTRAAP